MEPTSAADITAPESFVRFYRANVATVYGYLLRLCGGDRAQAEDLTQDTWLALCGQLANGRHERADIRWLLTVARCRFIDQARRALRARHWELHRTGNDGVEEDEPPEQDLLDLVNELDTAYRVVLILRYVDGLAVPEIAEEIGRSLTATNSLLARARAELRRRIGDRHG